MYLSLLCTIDLGDDRILIFASTEQLGILQSVHHFMYNGTFEVVPEIFYQLYIIHVVYRDHIIPVSYARLRWKNASPYERSFNEILKFPIPCVRRVSREIQLNIDGVDKGDIAGVSSSMAATIGS